MSGGEAGRCQGMGRALKVSHRFSLRLQIFFGSVSLNEWWSSFFYAAASCRDVRVFPPPTFGERDCILQPRSDFFPKGDHEMERAPKVKAAGEAVRQHAAATSLHTGTGCWSSEWLCSLCRRKKLNSMKQQIVIFFIILWFFLDFPPI